MYVVNASGELEKFDPKKIKRTCLRAGASNKLATKIVREVVKKTYDGISTKEILHITLTLLKKEEPFVATRYDLKGALFRLGPAGFAFEHLVSEVLKEYGYSTKVHTIVNGACVSHEVDVIATKDGKTSMVECKYHNLPGVYTGIRDVLYTYARFLDLEDGAKKGLCQRFDQPWLLCNTKFSDDTVKYAGCKKIKLMGWNYPKSQGLETMIEKKKLYPITMLKTLDRDSQEKLAKVGLILVIDLIRMNTKELSELTKISKKRLVVFISEAKGICRI